VLWLWALHNLNNSHKFWRNQRFIDLCLVKTFSQPNYSVDMWSTIEFAYADFYLLLRYPAFSPLTIYVGLNNCVQMLGQWYFWYSLQSWFTGMSSRIIAGPDCMDEDRVAQSNELTARTKCDFSARRNNCCDSMVRILCREREFDTERRPHTVNALFALCIIHTTAAHRL